MIEEITTYHRELINIYRKCLKQYLERELNKEYPECNDSIEVSWKDIE